MNDTSIYQNSQVKKAIVEDGFEVTNETEVQAMGHTYKQVDLKIDHRPDRVSNFGLKAVKEFISRGFHTLAGLASPLPFMGEKYKRETWDRGISGESTKTLYVETPKIDTSVLEARKKELEVSLPNEGDRKNGIQDKIGLIDKKIEKREGLLNNTDKPIFDAAYDKWSKKEIGTREDFIKALKSEIAELKYWKGALITEQNRDPNEEIQEIDKTLKHRESLKVKLGYDPFSKESMIAYAKAHLDDGVGTEYNGHLVFAKWDALGPNDPKYFLFVPDKAHPENVELHAVWDPKTKQPVSSEERFFLAIGDFAKFYSYYETAYEHHLDKHAKFLEQNREAFRGEDIDTIKELLRREYGTPILFIHPKLQRYTFLPEHFDMSTINPENIKGRIFLDLDEALTSEQVRSLHKALQETRLQSKEQASKGSELDVRAKRKEQKQERTRRKEKEEVELQDRKFREKSKRKPNSN